jgi:hypothetical protein
MGAVHHSQGQAQQGLMAVIRTFPVRPLLAE